MRGVVYEIPENATALKGVGQQKVADAIGSNRQSIHRYENGDYESDIQTLVLLAERSIKPFVSLYCRVRVICRVCWIAEASFTIK